MEPREWLPSPEVKTRDLRRPDPKSSSTENPCVKCGACCAFFRVVFFWREAEDNSDCGIDGDYRVPLHLTEDLDPFRRCMSGTTEKKGNRCVALQGRVGENATCQIYENRPSPCRAFSASYVDGKQNKRCNEAREAHGLKPLKLTEWNNG
jgi:Fe-S-cluster containining protein